MELNIKKLIFFLILIPDLVFGQGHFFFNQHDSGWGEEIFSLVTTSDSSSWAPYNVTKSGSTLHWEVTGAINTRSDANIPTFNFSSNTGHSNIYITVYADDGPSGLTLLNFNNPFTQTLHVTSIDISLATSLQTFYMNYNDITSIDISSNTNLQDLAIDYCNLSSINVSNNVNLTSLSIHSNSISSLNLTGLNLTTLICANNSSISSITALSSQTNLNVINVSNCNFTSLNLSSNTALVTLLCYSNTSLSTLTLPSTTTLTSIDSDNIAETYVSTTGCTNLTYVDFSNSSFTASAIAEIVCNLDGWGKSNGYVNVSGNDTMPVYGITCATSLSGKGWTVSY